MKQSRKNIVIYYLVLGLILVPNQGAFAFFVNGDNSNLPDRSITADTATDVSKNVYQPQGHVHHDVAKDVQHCKQDKTDCNQCDSCSFCNYVSGCFVWRAAGPDDSLQSQIITSEYSFAIATPYRPPISC